MEFVNYQPTKIIFGESKVDSLQKYVLPYGKKVFIIGPILCDHLKPLLSRLEKALISEISFHTFYEVESNPSTKTVESALTRMRDFKPDIIVGIGGGSVIDVAKICSILYKNPNYTWNYLFNTFDDFRASYDEIRNKLPVIAIPTTSGTGSQCTQACVITDTDKLKKTIFHQNLYPTLAILDPTLTLSLPTSITKATAFDAFSHCIESFLRTSNPLSNLYAKEGIKIIVHNLPLVLKSNDIKYRAELMISDTFGGISLSNCGAMLPHPLSEIIGSYTNICHGEALALVYPSFLINTTKKYSEKYAELSRYLFPTEIFSNDLDAANFFVKTIIAFMHECNLVKHISDYNIEQDIIDWIYKFITDIHLPMESPETIDTILNEILYKGD